MDAAPRLFKYLSPDKLDFFEQRWVLPTPPIYLNDPRDFLPKGRNPTEEEHLKVWRDAEMEKAKAFVIHLPAEFVHGQSSERLQKARDRANSKELAEGLSKYSRERISSEYDIVSLTEKPLCRLMWAYYAQSHTGFVPEFAIHTQFNYESFSACGCDLVPVQYAVKVEYSKPFKFRPWTAEAIATDCFSKHRQWKDEQEWRIIWQLNQSWPCDIKSSTGGKTLKRYCLPFEPTNLTTVIFGMRMHEMLKLEIIAVLEALNRLRESPGYEPCQLSEKKPGLSEELAAERKQLLEKERAELQEQADKLAEEIKELGGESPSRIV